MAGSSSIFRRARRLARTRISLLESLQGLIERTYDLETGVADIGRFVIGDEGYRKIYGDLSRPPSTGVAPPGITFAGTSGGGARTLVREAEAGLALSIYYPDSLVRCLEENDPTRCLDDVNVGPFNVLVEELDHFLVIAERYRNRRVMSLLDLELHANVTKYLVLKMFVAKLRGVRRLSEEDTLWVRYQVFEKGEFIEPDPDVCERYRSASRLAGRYVKALDGLSPPVRVPELRRFHRLSPQAKISRISQLSGTAPLPSWN